MQQLALFLLLLAVVIVAAYFYLKRRQQQLHMSEGGQTVEDRHQQDPGDRLDDHGHDLDNPPR